MLESNLHYFDYSQKNPEEYLDENYIFDEKNKNLALYLKRTKQIKELLLVIKTLEAKKEMSDVLDKYYKDLQIALKKYSNTSEFSAFINACDACVQSVSKDLVLLKAITKRFFKKRILNDVVPEEWIQAILDTHASRKKGTAGEAKLIEILVRNKYLALPPTNNWDNFQNENKVVVKFGGKKSDFGIKKIKERLKMEIKTTKQGKKLDLIIKNNERKFFLEAKHINISGGAQDKQISELIEIISLKEKDRNIFYISFLDGYKSNQLLGWIKARDGKLRNQQKEIINNLKDNPNSFWLNTAGFKKFITDLG